MQTANSDRNMSLATLQERVEKANEPDENGVMPYEDPVEPSQLELLNIPPEERETHHIDGLVEMISKNAAEFCVSLTDDQQSDIARCGLYHFFTPGVMICDTDEETAFFFVVLRGSVQIDERQVHHQEGTKGTESNMRTTIVEAGKGFHHFPLVMQSRFYGYSARVVAETGASVLLISRQDYIFTLRRSVEKEMTDTVNMLKATPFFSSWSETSVTRLYFWFERKRMAPEEDVVRQGDDADFCFIIRSGRCDVLVELPPEEEAKPAEKPKEEGGSSEAAAPAPKKAFGGFAAKKKDLLKMAAAQAFLGDTAGRGLPPLRANMRHIVTLRPGAIVGEIALFKDGVKRMATVRSSEHVELMILDKRSFLDLDRATLNSAPATFSTQVVAHHYPNPNPDPDALPMPDLHGSHCREREVQRRMHQGAWPADTR